MKCWAGKRGALARTGGVQSRLRMLFASVFLLCASPVMAMVDVEDISVSGVPVWYAADMAVPVVHLIFTFEEAGTASDPDTLSGRAMLAAKMLNEGAGDLDSQSFHKALDARAIQFSARVEQDDLVVELHTLKDELPAAMALVTDALTQPRNDAAMIDAAKEEQRVALKATRESPASIARLALSSGLYGTHPYARQGIGDEQSIEALTRSDLDSYRTRYVTRANMQVAAAGDISESQLEEVLEPLIAALPEAFFPERDMPGVVPQGKGEVKRIAHDVPQSVVVFGGPGLPRSDKRYYAAYLMNHALGGGSLSSRLMRAVRVKKGLVYSVSTGLSNADGADGFGGQFATRNETVDEAIATMKEAMQDLAERGLSARECTDIRREVIQGFTLNLDSTQSIARVIAMMMRYDLGTDYMEKRTVLFEDVRCKDIQAAAKALLKPDTWMFVVVGGEAKARTPEAK